MGIHAYTTADPRNTTASNTMTQNDSRIYSAEELELICPILKIMHVLDMIGVTSLRSVYINWGEHGYIIRVYDRL